MSIKVENMANEVSKKGYILPHQRQAFQLIDRMLTDEQRVRIAEVWRQPQANPTSETLLRFIPTDRWDYTRRGRLRQWLLQLTNNGRVVDQITAWSGAPGSQDFIDPKHDYPGSLRPLPPGRYRVGLVEVAATGSFGAGLGRIWIGLTPLNPPNARSNFGIHLDANKETSPGSAGCIVTKNEQDLQRVVGWLKQRNRPEFLDCVHIIGGNPGGTQTIPKSGLDLIKKFEGCHLKAYPDPISGGDPWTIGWGLTRYPDGRKVRPGDVISQAKADEYLIEYCHRIVDHLAKTIPGWNELSENRKGALLSFAYNVGMGFYGAPGFATITARLRNREYEKVPEALLLYRNPGTKAESGLLRRRKAEGELWMRLS